MNPTPPIRLLLADDHYIVVMGLRAVLELDEGLEVVAAAGDGAEAVRLYREHRPDVALLDLRMPKLDGIAATVKIRAEFPDAKIIILTSFEWEEDIHQALQSGISGYLLKGAKQAELSQAIRTVHGGGRWLPEHVAKLAAERVKQPELSKRETEVLDLVTKGLTNKEIARVLGLSEDGAKHHLRRIYAKLGVETRAEATAEALRRGIVRQD